MEWQAKEEEEEPGQASTELGPILAPGKPNQVAPTMLAFVGVICVD